MESIREAMYAKIVRGDWNYNWRLDGCQQYRTTGATAYTFCGKDVHHNRLCLECTQSNSAQQLQQSIRRAGFTPQTYFECSKKLAEKIARSNLQDEV